MKPRPTKSTRFPHTTRVRSAAPGAAARRAAVRARPEAAPGDAGGAAPAAPRDRRHVRVRDPRPGRGAGARLARGGGERSEEHTSELQSRQYLVFRLLPEKTK